MPIADEARIKKNEANLTKLPLKVLQQLHEIELDALARFNGMTDEVESAIGFLHLGFQIGWKPLAVLHSKVTFRKYETILGINAREIFPEETPASDRSRGYRFVKTLSNFWKAVNGEIKVEHKREIVSPCEV